MLSKKSKEKMARADAIEAEREAMMLELQKIRKDIAHQEAWLQVVSACMT